jgi:RNase P subunit RPR2
MAYRGSVLCGLASGASGVRRARLSAKLAPTEQTMTKPVLGKEYLVVFCKNCQKGFRVVPDALYEGKPVEVREGQTLTCRGCGHQARYELNEMRVAKVEKKNQRP